MTRRRVIGVLTPYLGGFYFGAVIDAIQRAAADEGYRVIVVQTATPNILAVHQSSYTPLAWKLVDGWICIADAIQDLYQLSRKSSPKAMVSISSQHPEIDAPAIFPDNRGGIATLVNHLVDHGHTRIAFAGFMLHEDIRQRFEGYRAALAERGLVFDPALTFEFDETADQIGYRFAQSFKAAGPPPFSALICATDLNAVGAIRGFKEAGYRVPEDVAVAGFDDIELAVNLSPPLTTVRQEIAQLGTFAVEALLEQLKGGEVARHIAVPTTMIVRRSCGCNLAGLEVQEQIEELQAAGWRERSAQALVGAMIAPQRLETDAEPLRIWPLVPALISALELALAGEQPDLEQLRAVWQQAARRAPHPENVLRVIEVMRVIGRGRLPRGQKQAAGTRLDTFLAQMSIQAVQVASAHSAAQRATLDRLVQGSYEVSMAVLLGEERDVLRELTWLRWTPVRWACVALYNRQLVDGQLSISGVYGDSGQREGLVGSTFAPEQFPPLEQLESPGMSTGEELMTLVPIRTKAREWGVLALFGSINANTYEPIETMGQLAALLSAALERAELQQRLVRANRDLEAAKQAAEEASRLKSQFLANMSHELRTPLNAIIGFTDLLTDLEAPEDLAEARRLRGRISSNGEHLLGLINDILDLSKIEAGRMELFYEEIDLGPILAGVMSTAVGLTGEKGLRLQLDVPEQLPRVRIDKTRIRQVLLNLLSNAAKFTSEGSITLRVCDRQDGMLQIDVADTGIGIAPEHHALIFEEFRQVESDMSRHYQGTGLGLPICRRLVEMHGGTMWLASEPGAGSTFSFTLPAQRQSASPSQRAPARGATLKQDRPLVVVVEDDPSAQEIMRHYLEGGGYRVAGVLDGRQAIETIRELQPRLVILDIVLPNMDGWQILTAIRNLPEIMHIPVILCSILDQQQMGVALGMNAHLTKPIRQEDLLRVVHYWAGTPRRVLVVDDSADARLLVRSILERIGCQVIEATDGAQALETLRQTPSSFDMMILDLMMPEIDGFEVLRLIRADAVLRALPVIIVTAKDLDAQEQEWLRQQAQGCLRKGTLSTQEFLDYVRRLTQQRGSL